MSNWIFPCSVFLFVSFAFIWNNTLLLVCRTSDQSDQTGTGKASESPCWLSWWCCHSLGCPSSCCQKVKTSSIWLLIVLVFFSSWRINAAQWGSIRAPPTVRCDWLLPCTDSSSQMAVTDTRAHSWHWMTSSTGTFRSTILMQSGSAVSARPIHHRVVFAHFAAPRLLDYFVREGHEGKTGMGNTMGPTLNPNKTNKMPTNPNLNHVSSQPEFSCTLVVCVRMSTQFVGSSPGRVIPKTRDLLNERWHGLKVTRTSPVAITQDDLN